MSTDFSHLETNTQASDFTFSTESQLVGSEHASQATTIYDDFSLSSLSLASQSMETGAIVGGDSIEALDDEDGFDFTPNRDLPDHACK